MGYGSKNASKIIHQITEQLPFKIGNMKAAWYPSSLLVPTGELREGFKRNLRAAGDGDRPVYVVFSYSTPIAWRTAGQLGWTEPPTWYSKTTAQHQALAHWAILRGWDKPPA